MKLEGIKSLAIPEIKVLRYARFCDHRGYFTESFRKSDFKKISDEIGDWEIMQGNESFSKENTIRGLHFQWNPYMGKLVRTIQGHMIDLILDIRKSSPNFGKIIAYDMPSVPENNYYEWIWVPVGFAHGNMFLKETTIEYFCSGEYSPGNEAGISPFSDDIDWSICDKNIKDTFMNLKSSGAVLITDKDEDGYSIKEWSEKEESNNFKY